jgi:uncharacterized membrane protein
MAAEMKYGDYIGGGWNIVKANLVPSIVAALAMIIPFVGLIVMVNYMAAVKAAKHEGKPIEIGALFNFENAVDKILGPLVFGIIVMIASMCFVLPGIAAAGVFYFSIPILADKPGTPWMNAIKAGMAFGKANLVPCILVSLVLGIVAGLGQIACGVGMLITLPIGLAAHFLAYEDHKAAIEAAAAQGGVQI